MSLLYDTVLLRISKPLLSCYKWVVTSYILLTVFIQMCKERHPELNELHQSCIIPLAYLPKSSLSLWFENSSIFYFNKFCQNVYCKVCQIKLFEVTYIFCES